MTRLALLALALTGCTGSWLLDRDALSRTMVNDRQAIAIVGGDAEPRLSVKPGDKGFLEEGPPGDRQVHLYSKQRDATTVVAAKPLHRDLRIVVIRKYSGPPSSH